VAAGPWADSGISKISSTESSLRSTIKQIESLESLALTSIQEGNQEDINQKIQVHDESSKMK
jgi:hypothetical protein